MIGTWVIDDGWQRIELLFRSDGRYQLDTISTDPVFGNTISERGRYHVTGDELALTPYEYFGEPQSKRYELQLTGDTMSLTRIDFGFTDVYQFQPGSRQDVLAREQASEVLVGTWTRYIQFWGEQVYTFRPDGYYFRKDVHENSEFPPDFIRGRYTLTGNRLTLNPYSGTEAQHELDFFGNQLTLIESDGSYGEWATYELVPGSEAEVRAKAAEAEAFFNRANWQVGVWEVRNNVEPVDLTIRPDGHYSATNHSEFLSGIVRGRYTLEQRRIRLSPFIGQGLYSRSNGEFGKVERVRELDYWDGELQIIDLESLSQSVTLARKRAGSEATVMEKASQARIERERAGWYLGIWEVNDPTGWMEFTFRPDERYIAKSGASGVPGRVERGRYRFAAEKVTLAPYSGLGAARGFELDLYDGELFLVGDSYRMVVARKVPGSEAVVVEKTSNPEAMKGERGSILGLWTASLPGQYEELVFRHDGEFRLKRCSSDVVSDDYGLYTVDVTARTLVYDSRFVPVQTQGLDFYGHTMTIHGGLGAPKTYTVNLGTVDTSIEASFAADAAETVIDAQWLARVPIATRDPNAVQIPGGDIPADPFPGRIFENPTVFKNYQLYRRLILGAVYFNHLGNIVSVNVVNTREWHFFPTGRVLVRFKNYRAGAVYPTTVADISDSWGAYIIEPKPEQRDILHRYADNSVFINMDIGEEMEMTLEDGRRNLFWGKDYMILSEWATERKPVPCELPANADPSLMNNGLELSTTIPPDPTGESGPMRIHLTGPISGNFMLSGTAGGEGTIVVERTRSLGSPAWEPIQTNSVSTGPFNFSIPQGTDAAAFFRVRAQ